MNLNLKLIRTKFLPTHTIGQLYINEEYFCFVLEDVVRYGQKIPGETAIPYGTYPITMETSPRFGPDCLTVRNVPDFTGIRIHSGNTAADTEGCLIVGYQLTEQDIIKPGTTKTALSDLKAVVKKAIDSGEKVQLEITKLY
jgi:hypothetical protein